MNCLKKGFRFLGDVIKKMGPGFLGGIKKKAPFPSLPFFVHLPSLPLLPPYCPCLLPTDCASYLEFSQHSMPLQGFEPSHHRTSEITESVQMFFLPMSLSYFQAFTTTTISHMRKSVHTQLKGRRWNFVKKLKGP